MAFRYRIRFFEDGDVLDPRDWTDNHAELAAEWNSHLDRDNFDEISIATARIVPTSFTVVESIPSTPGTTVSGDTVAWRDLDTLTISCDVDSVVEAEWSGTWTWTGPTSADNIALRIIVAGIEVCRVPRVNAAFGVESVGLLCGEIDVPQGENVVVLQVRLYADTDGENSPTTGSITVNYGELIAVARKR